MIACITVDKNTVFKIKKLPHWEDGYFTNNYLYKMRLPTNEIAMQFSSESVYYKHSIGFHKPYWYFSPEIMEEIYEYIKSFSKTNTTLILESESIIDVPTAEQLD
jgi:hypothetical protein